MVASSSELRSSRGDELLPSLAVGSSCSGATAMECSLLVLVVNHPPAAPASRYSIIGACSLFCPTSWPSSMSRRCCRSNGGCFLPMTPAPKALRCGRSVDIARLADAAGFRCRCVSDSVSRAAASTRSIHCVGTITTVLDSAPSSCASVTANAARLSSTIVCVCVRWMERWWCFGGAGFVPAAWARAVVGSVVVSKNSLLKKPRK